MQTNAVEKLNDSQYFGPKHLFCNQLLRFVCTWRLSSCYQRNFQVDLVIADFSWHCRFFLAVVMCICLGM